MTTFLNVWIGLIALQHLLFLYLEIFLWTKPLGLKIFRQSKEKAQASSTLAANQGIYNGFLSAGLAWSLMHPQPAFALQLKIFFLSCVFVAGCFGGISVNPRIFFIQAAPAAFALFFCFYLG